MHLLQYVLQILNMYIGRSKGWLKGKMVITPSRPSQVTKSVENKPNKQQVDFTIEVKFENSVEWSRAQLPTTFSKESTEPVIKVHFFSQFFPVTQYFHHAY